MYNQSRKKTVAFSSSRVAASSHGDCGAVETKTGRSLPNKKPKWTPEEDVILLRRKGEGLTWKQVAACLPGRTKAACQIHYSELVKASPRSKPGSRDKTRWTESDARLACPSFTSYFVFKVVNQSQHGKLFV